MGTLSNFSQSLPWHRNEPAAPSCQCCSSWTNLSTDAVVDVWDFCSLCVSPATHAAFISPQDASDHGKWQGCIMTVSVTSQEDYIPFAFEMRFPSIWQYGTL